MSKVEQSISDLEQCIATTRCSELVGLLERLGFTVRRGRRGGHHVYTHSALAGFLGSSFDCGHGRNDTIKRSYIRNVLRILELYKAELRSHLGELGDHQ